MLLCAQVYTCQQTETSNKPGKYSLLLEDVANFGTHGREVHFPGGSHGYLQIKALVATQIKKRASHEGFTKCYKNTGITPVSSHSAKSVNFWKEHVKSKKYCISIP